MATIINNQVQMVAYNLKTNHHINCIFLLAFISVLSTQQLLTTLYWSSLAFLLFEHSSFYIHSQLIIRITSRPTPIHEWPQLFFTSKSLDANLNASSSTLISYSNLLQIKMVNQRLFWKNSCHDHLFPPSPEQFCLNSPNCFNSTMLITLC